MNQKPFLREANLSDILMPEVLQLSTILPSGYNYVDMDTDEGRT